MKRAGGEEALFEEADSALDATFFLGPIRRAQPRLDVQLGRQVEQQRVEANGVAVALDYDGFGVVE